MTSGPLFDSFKENIKQRGMDVRAVWVLEPLEVLVQIGPNAGQKIA